jgi:hypothetical protein
MISNLIQKSIALGIANVCSSSKEEFGSCVVNALLACDLLQTRSLISFMPLFFLGSD